jgi:Cu2+-exporting ATPase
MSAPQSAPASRTETCYHCALPVTTGTSFQVEVDGVAHNVCCLACKAVAETILGNGLGNYYRYRDAPAPGDGEAAPSIDNDFTAFDTAEFQQLLARQHGLRELPDGRCDIDLLIGGMHCAACTWLLEHQLRRLPGISEVQVNLGEQRAHVSWLPQQVRLSDICAAIAAIGYQPQPYGNDQFEQLRRRENRDMLRRLGVSGIGSMQVGMAAVAIYAGDIQGGIDDHWRDFMRWVSLLLSIPIVFYAGWPFFTGAWRGLRARMPGMDVPVAVAIALAFGASVWATLRGTGEIYYDSVTMFIFLLIGARYLELRARHFGGRLGLDLLSLLPATATRIEADGTRTVIALDHLQVGDTALVASGQYLPADGELLDEQAYLNEAAITGEFLPVRKTRGDLLLAGSVNGEQALTLRVTGTGSQLRLNAIQQLSRDAATQKPRLAQLADRLSSHFVAIILLLSAGAWIVWHFVDPSRAFWIALSVLVVSCPCALGLATPVALTNATTTLRRLGLLVTKADAWEQLPRITDIVFDKTGTLTEGRVRIAATQPCGERDPQICRAIAAALEAGSSHPIALAFTHDHAVTPAEQTVQVTGRGIEGTIAGRRYRLGEAAFAAELCNANASPPTADGQWLLLADSNAPLCWFQLDDQPRADAAATVASLRERGFALHLLSGDRSATVAALARELRIEHATAGALPETKLDYVRGLQRQGKRVLMVGDGINDIPVLAAADVSVAMTAASQLAKAHADCILLSSRLDRLLPLLTHARRTRHIVRENLGWALLYNVIAIPLAALGLVPPWVAAVGMSLSSLLVVGNALRLLKTPAAP